MDLVKKISDIETKVQRLAIKLAESQARNATLLEENNNLININRLNEAKTETLLQQLAKTQQALESKRKDDPESVQDMRQTIDKYVVEIDKCIEWLHNSQ